MGTIYFYKIIIRYQISFIRLLTENRIKLFNDNLANETDLISNNDLVEVDSTYELFSNNYLKLFDKYFPYVKQSRKSFKDKPYITREIKTSIKIRNTLYKKHLNNQNHQNHPKHPKHPK